MISNKKLFHFILLIFCFISISFNQKSSEFDSGFKDGVMAAKNNKIWRATCLSVVPYCAPIGIAGLAAAYIYNPEPKPAILIGKSPDYIVGFQEGFGLEQKKYNKQNALIGCGTAFASCLGVILFNVVSDFLN